MRYIYISNESDEPVYFDKLQVKDTRGRIIEEDHYYAFGLKIAGISSVKLLDSNEGNINNKNLYNDKELIDEADLNWYDYGFRNYDPQIGRFTQLDPLTDQYAELTPYQYASNDPIANIDIDGLEGGNVLEPVTVTGFINHATSLANAAAAARMVFQIVTRGGPLMYNYSNATGQNFKTQENTGSIRWGDQQWNNTNSPSQDVYTSYEQVNCTCMELPLTPAENIAKWYEEYHRLNDFHRVGTRHGNIRAYTNGRGETREEAGPTAAGNKEYGSGIMFDILTLGTFAEGKAAAEGGAAALDDSFSITEFGWQGYPKGIPKPSGPFRLLQGEEYAAARKAANNAYSALSNELDLQ